MPRHRRFIGANLSAALLLLCIISMASAQDPFDAAVRAPTAPTVKESSGEAGKPGEKPAEKKSAGKPEPEFVRKTLLEWQRSLPRDVFSVTRLKATEPPFSGRFATGHFDGTFVCACCDAELFSSRAKFDSGTGWPSFWQPIKGAAIDRAIDNSEAEPRIEVTCHRCGAHLGHVFDDAPATPTGLRFCINSLSLKLRSDEGQTSRPASAKSKARTTRARSRGTARTSRTKPAAKAAEPSDSEKPAAGGKTDEGTR